MHNDHDSETGLYGEEVQHDLFNNEQLKLLRVGNALRMKLVYLNPACAWDHLERDCTPDQIFYRRQHRQTRARLAAIKKELKR